MLHLLLRNKSAEAGAQAVQCSGHRRSVAGGRGLCGLSACRTVRKCTVPLRQPRFVTRASLFDLWVKLFPFPHTWGVHRAGARQVITACPCRAGAKRTQACVPVDSSSFSKIICPRPRTALERQGLARGFLTKICVSPKI